MTDIPRYLVIGTKCIHIGLDRNSLLTIDISSLDSNRFKKVHLIIFKEDAGYNELSEKYLSKIKDLASKSGKRKLVVHFIGFDTNPLLGVKGLKSYKEKELTIKSGKTTYYFSDNSLIVSKKNGYIAYYPYKDKIFEVEKIFTRNKEFILYDRKNKKIFNDNWALSNGKLYINNAKIEKEDQDNYILTVCSKGVK